MFDMITLIIIGIVIGLAAGPIVNLGFTAVAYMARSKSINKNIEQLYDDHKKSIDTVKKKYKKSHDKYMDVRGKLIKLTDELKNTTKPATEEDADDI